MGTAQRLTLMNTGESYSPLNDKERRFRMKTECSCGKTVADEQLIECSKCNCLLCDMCGLGHTCGEQIDLSTEGNK